MNNDPSNPNSKVSPAEASALVELGLSLFTSGKAGPATEELEQAVPIDVVDLQGDDIPSDSTLHRIGIDGLTVQYEKLSGDRGDEGAEIVVVFANYTHSGENDERNKIFFASKSKEGKADISVAFAADATGTLVEAEKQDALELRSVLLAAHEIV